MSNLTPSAQVFAETVSTPPYPHGSGLHCETYSSSRDGHSIGVPCWCAIGENHSYAQWLVMGQPDTSRPY